MLADQFSRVPDVQEIIAIDLLPRPGFLQDNKKIRWIEQDLSADGWQGKVGVDIPEVVVHCAWQIRDSYIFDKKQYRQNVVAVEKLSSYCFEGGVKKLIYFSTISSYGAFPTNTTTHRFIENDPPREKEFRYGVQKKEAEVFLKKRYLASDKKTQVFILRPATIAGPRERYMMGKKGLVYMLRPDEQIGLEHKKRFTLMTLLRRLLFAMPIASSEWCRQYIHEDDVTDIVGLLVFGKVVDRYEVFNISPDDIVRADDMATIFGRKKLSVRPWMVRLAFALAWHVTWGKIPTSRGGWRFYCYPIAVDGSKITRKYHFAYQYSSRDALTKDEGRYAFAKMENVIPTGDLP